LDAKEKIKAQEKELNRAVDQKNHIVDDIKRLHVTEEEKKKNAD